MARSVDLRSAFTRRSIEMTQRSVEVLIGRLATDEPLRRRFAANAEEVLRLLEAEGLRFSPVETAALVRLPSGALDRFAGALDPRLQKASLDIHAITPRRRS
jgi:hypothetical protein